MQFWYFKININSPAKLSTLEELIVICSPFASFQIFKTHFHSLTSLLFKDFNQNVYLASYLRPLPLLLIPLLQLASPGVRWKDISIILQIFKTMTYLLKNINFVIDIGARFASQKCELVFL